MSAILSSFITCVKGRVKMVGDDLPRIHLSGKYALYSGLFWNVRKAAHHEKVELLHIEPAVHLENSRRVS